MTSTSLRYSRHILLKEFGDHGQKTLASCHILVVGAGGVGSPAALYLAESGVGTLTIIDSDTVDISNLPRQILHTQSRIGMNKAESAKKTIAEINPDVHVQAVSTWADETTLSPLVEQADIIVDCCDNFKTRHSVNRVAWRFKKSLISASAVRFSGQLAVFDFHQAQSPCYQCIFPEDDDADVKAAQTGVFAPITGMIGVLAADQAIKLALGLPSLAGQLLILDSLSMQMQTFAIKADETCSVCSRHAVTANAPSTE